MLELCDGKLSRTVLKGEWGCEAPDLLDIQKSMNEIDYFKPIRNFGYFFIAISILICVVLLFGPPLGPSEI